MNGQVVQKVRRLKKNGFFESHIAVETGLTIDQVADILRPPPQMTERQKVRRRRQDRVYNLHRSIAEVCGEATLECVIANFGNLVKEEEIREIYKSARAN